MPKGKYETNTFYHYAEENRKTLIEETEIEKVDFTQTFWKELETMPTSGELINININAPPTSGKSVTGMAIADKIMKKIFKRPLNITDIDRDQQEFSQTMRNPKIKNTIRVIDEWNELETTGENSSVETALYNYFSDVMAQRFVHKISCSPKESADKNALIYLEVISTDKVTLTNHCKLYYRLYSGGMEIRQLIGIVSIYVGDILEQKWYAEYRQRKFEKMNLILKEGIFQPRKLEYAEVIKAVSGKLEKLAKMTNIINSNIIRNYIKMECRERKVPQSIVGEELATREVNGIVELHKGLSIIKKKIKKLTQEQLKQEKLKKYVLADIATKEIKELQEVGKEIKTAIDIQMKELDKMKEIHQKYNKIENEPKKTEQ